MKLGGLLLFLFGLLSLIPISMAENKREDLSDHKWKHRLILIFSDKKLESQFDQQKAEIVDRHIVYYQVGSNGQSSTNSKIKPSPELLKYLEGLKAKYSKKDSGDQDLIVLIGKDGGVKLTSESLEWKKIYALIDSMPMRQREMRAGR